MNELYEAWSRLKTRVDELGAERQQYLELFEQACDAYVMTDREGIIHDANGAAIDLLQRRKQSLRGKPLAALVPLLQRQEFRARLGALRQAGAGLWRTLLRSGEAVLEVDVAVRRSPSGILCWRLSPVQ
jgi:PAS domain S-box-containing protein